MVRTFNYTDRERVYHHEIDLEINWEEEPHPSFSCKFNFDEGKYPADARVFLEADRRESVLRMRFDYGTVGNLSDTPLYLSDKIEQNKLHDVFKNFPLSQTPFQLT